MVDKKKKIIIVDDCAKILEAYKDIFTSKGYDIATATNGVEALNLIKKQKYDILVTDLKMPKMDGFELTDKTKQIDEDIPIILISSYTDSIKNCPNINLYVPKSQGLESLIRAVEKFIK